ncbi:MAG: peptidoglycan editing factor PgeF [Chlamydiae bacterium]|nr:peptidoglycan editing factor PgeF [Chlamydiota bacterium]
MIRKKKGNVEWLEFEQLADRKEIIHGCFLRHGGVSKPPFHSLNFGGGTGDETDAVKENRKIISQVFENIPLIAGHQQHGINIQIIPSPAGELNENCDGLITRENRVGLSIKHADCQAAIFYDPIKRVIANIHCGWRGNVQNIYKKTIEELKEKFSCRPENILVCISPSLGPKASEFKNYERELPKSFLRFQIKPTYFDLWEISKMQLIEEKILEKHIEIAQVCTYNSPEDFFSYRKEKVTGRNVTIVALK